MGDTVDPLGATFQNPLVLLHQHNSDEPIGQVVFDKPTAKGIPFTATIPVVKEPGLFKDRVDMAWAEIHYGVVRAVSIGFRPLKYAFNENGGIDFQEVEIFELSAVSIPALPQAVITQVKSMEGGPLPRDIIHEIRARDVVSKGVKLMSARDSSLSRGAIDLRPYQGKSMPPGSVSLKK